MAKGRPKQAKEGAPEQGEKVNKMEAMRQVLRELGFDAKPAAIGKVLLEKHGLDMSPNLISNYKNLIAKKQASQSSVIARPAEPAAPPPSIGDISIEDLRAVRELAKRIGPDKVRRVAEVLCE